VDLVLTAFSVEVTKIAAEKSKKRRGYLAAVGASAPFAVGKALADIPKGVVDKAVESKIRTGRIKNVFGRGLGRSAGSLAAGGLTAPVFLSGIKDIKSGKTKSEKRRGMAKVVGSGLAYSATRGAIEGAAEHGLSRTALSKIKNLATSRGLVGVGAGTLTAASVGRSLRKSKSEKKGLKKYLAPAAVGAAAGAGKGSFDELYAKGLKALKTPKGRRGVGAAAGGRAAAGALGGLALTELARRALKEKKAEAVDVGPTAGQLYDQVYTWARPRPVDVLKARYEEILARGDPEATPTRRAVAYAMSDALQLKGQPTPQLHRRDRVSGQQQIPNAGVRDVAAVATTVIAPSVVWNLVFGRMKPTQREMVLGDALDMFIAQHGIERMEAGKNFWGTPQSMSYTAGEQKIIRVSKGVHPAHAAHELGHATAGKLRLKTVGSQAADMVAGYGKASAVLLSLIALGGTNDRSFTTPEEMESRANFAKNMGLVTTLMQLPHLAEEAAASAKGLGYLALAGAGKSELGRAAAVMGSSFATHAAPAVIPFVAAAHLRRKAKKGRERATQH